MPKLSDFKRFNIEPVPLRRLYITTDKQMRIKLSTDLAETYGWRNGVKLALGYDAAANAIALRTVSSSEEAGAASFDKRLYASARKFFAKTRIEAESRRYDFVAEEDGWLVFVAKGAQK